MAKPKGKWSRVIALASVCWMGLVVLLVVGVAINWNLFRVVGGMMGVFMVGLAIIYLPGVLKRWHERTERQIAKRTDQYASQMANPSKGS